VGGALVALLALRLGGLFLALASFGFGLLCEQLIFNQPWAFKSQSGINPPRPVLGPIDFQSNRAFLVLALLALALAIWVVHQVASGATGRFLRALRGSETAAASIGISATPIKLVVFTLSAGMAGTAGGLLGSLQTLATPSAFTSQTSLYWLVVVLVIGVHTIRGAVVGGLLLVLLPEVVSHLPPEYALAQFVLFGLGVVTLAKHPEGALELLLGLPTRWRQRRAPDLTSPDVAMA
jgi:branched-chain amino acid transport system permease protein